MSVLFRPEVTEAHARKLHGDVNLAVPLAWQAIGLLIGIALVVAATFLTLASYSRAEYVTGTIVTDRGVAAIVPTRTGTVQRIAVRDGQQVRAGDELLAVRAEEEQSSGATVSAGVLSALRQADGELSNQAAAARAAADAQREQIRSQQAGLAGEIASLTDQIALQEQLVRSAQEDFERTKPVAGRGFISASVMRAREDGIAQRRQQLSQLHQALVSRQSALAESTRQIAQIGAQATAQDAAILSSRATLRQQVATADASRGYVLRAPIAGTVTALTARMGQVASAQGAVMTVVPDGARLRAELHVPTAAVGFVAPGQEVRLAVDAFPYQRFGTVAGRVADVARVPTPVRGDAAPATMAYLVTVDLTGDGVAAYGRSRALLPGMTLNARIITARQSLFRWLFDPLFAIQKR